MRSVLSLAATALIVMAGPAFAGNNNGGHNSNNSGGTTTVSNQNTNLNGNWNRNSNRNQNSNANINQNVNSNSNRQHQGQAQGQLQGQGQSQSVSSQNTVSGGNQSYNVNNPGYTYFDGNPWANPAASAVAPSVYVSSICQTGVSGAIQLPMVGISFGVTNGREFCVAMMQAHEYAANPAMKRYFECTSSDVRAAYRAVGQPCPQDGGVAYSTPVAAVSGPVVATVAAASPAPYKAPANCHVVPGTTALTCE